MNFIRMFYLLFCACVSLFCLNLVNLKLLPEGVLKNNDVSNLLISNFTFDQTNMFTLHQTYKIKAFRIFYCKFYRQRILLKQSCPMSYIPNLMVTRPKISRCDRRSNQKLLLSSSRLGNVYIKCYCFMETRPKVYQCKKIIIGPDSGHVHQS